MTYRSSWKALPLWLEGVADEGHQLLLPLAERGMAARTPGDGSQHARLGQRTDDRGGEREQQESGVVAAELAGLHPPLEKAQGRLAERLEGVGHPLHDRRAPAGGLPEEEREFGPVLCEAEQRPDDGLHPVQAAVRAAQHPAERLLEAVDQSVDAGVEEVLLGREVVEERLLADPGRLGDGLEGGAVVAPGAERAEGVPYQLLLAPLPGKAAHRRRVTAEVVLGVGGGTGTS